MNKSLRAPAVIANIFLVLGLIILWITFAPASIGGRVSYVMVNGISMEPGFHLGDLTILRRDSNYQVGDIVTYHDSQMQAYVIHRIIGIDQDQFILKGDNNSWIDAYRPTQEEIIGKLVGPYSEAWKSFQVDAFTTEPGSRHRFARRCSYERYD